MKTPLHLLHLCPSALEDRLSIRQLCAVLRRHQDVRFVVTHGSGLDAMQTGLAHQAPFEKQVENTVSYIAEYERDIREINRRIVATLTEEGVSAVSFQGTDMGLFQVDKNGKLACTVDTALCSMVAPGIVPVISLLTAVDDAAVGELEPFVALPRLAHVLQGGETATIDLVASGAESRDEILANAISREIEDDPALESGSIHIVSTDVAHLSLDLAGIPSS